MKKILFYIALFAFVFIGCKKSSSNASNTCTLSTSAIAGTYKMTAQVLTTATQSVDIFNDPSQTDPCSKDNIYTFNANGNYTVADGVDVCSPSDAETGTWTLNGSNISINDGTSTQVATVSEFTCTSFKLTVSPTAGVSVLVTFLRQ